VKWKLCAERGHSLKEYFTTMLDSFDSFSRVVMRAGDALASFGDAVRRFGVTK
jgi:hypothetical protein